MAGPTAEALPEGAYALLAPDGRELGRFGGEDLARRVAARVLAEGRLEAVTLRWREGGRGREEVLSNLRRNNRERERARGEARERVRRRARRLANLVAGGVAALVAVVFTLRVAEAVLEARAGHRAQAWASTGWTPAEARRP
jgi:hypothetical protein